MTMFTLLAAIVLSFIGVGTLCYQAGADKARAQSEFDRHSADALALVAEAGSRTRHPSAR
jgi:hypothetical protein